MINRVVLVGRLTKDAEIRKTGSGIAMATFTVACDRMKKKDEEKQADFIRCIAWRQSAEYLEKYASKGMVIGVDGRLQTGSYEKDGQTHYTTDVVCDNVRIVESKKQTSSEPRNVATESHSLKEYADEISQNFGTADGYVSNDDLPF